MDNDWPLALFLLLVSPAVGSFLGVLVDRLPDGRANLTAASRCAECGARIGWRDLVPVVSAIGLRHRCRACGAAIPGHLMRIEVAAVLAALLAVVLTAGAAEMWLKAALLWCLIALFYSDLLHFRLPDALNLMLLLLGLFLAWGDPARGLSEAVLSAAAAAAAFWLIRWGYRLWRGRHGLGAGDVKLMAGIGAAVGWELVPVVTLLAAGLALAVLAAEFLAHRTAPAADTRLPFGSYLAAAAAAILIL